MIPPGKWHERLMKVGLYLLPAIAVSLFLFSTLISTLMTKKKSHYKLDPLQYPDPVKIENFNFVVIFSMGLYNLFLNLVSIYFISASIYLGGKLIKKLNKQGRVYSVTG